MDLGAPREIRTVSIVMGRNDSDTDAVNKGQLEVSMDGLLSLIHIYCRGPSGLRAG